MVSKDKECGNVSTFNMEIFYRGLNVFPGGWGCHDFIRIVFNFQSFLGLNSIKNMMFNIIMCLHSTLHTEGQIIFRNMLYTLEKAARGWTLMASARTDSGDAYKRPRICTTDWFLMVTLPSCQSCSAWHGETRRNSSEYMSGDTISLRTSASLSKLFL